MNKAKPKGEIYVENMDKHWKEVMDLAEKYGFIIQAYAGVATLATHEVQNFLYNFHNKKNLAKKNTKGYKK